MAKPKNTIRFQDGYFDLVSDILHPNLLKSAADKLSRFSVPKDSTFNMALWGFSNQEDSPKCGTAACAIGWIAIKGFVPGLTAEWKSYPDMDNVFQLRFRVNGRTRLNGFEVAASVFGITLPAAEHLFFPLKRRETKDNVVARIRTFLQDGVIMSSNPKKQNRFRRDYSVSTVEEFNDKLTIFMERHQIV